MDLHLQTSCVGSGKRSACWGRQLTWVILTIVALLAGGDLTGGNFAFAAAGEQLTLQQIFDEGAALERQEKWAEALSLYQAALKSAPQNEDLRIRRSVARIHYDLDRRYSDGSFLSSVDQTDPRTSASIYAEVLTKIQSYYVDTPNWSELASYGLTSLEVALMSDEFCQRNLPGVSREAIDREIMRNREIANESTVDSRSDTYQFAHRISQSLDDNLGLRRQAAMYEFICGAISALDPYSAFMSSNQYSETMSQIEGNFVGLGVELRTHEDNLEIVSVIPNGSADAGGLVEGDRIISVDNQIVNEVGGERAADMLRGVEGSFVSVTIDRGDGGQQLRLERRRVEIPSVDQVSIVDEHNGVGYIRLTSFQKTTAKDFDEALWKLHRQGMRSLIVDVRGNPGGLLSASVEVADRFITDGVIVSTRGRNTLENYVHRANLERTWRVPLVVLVDSNSASASEIFASAIHEHQRGAIVGSRSYGKGSVQGIFPLSVAGGGVRLTTAKFYSPNGNPISQVGVQADYNVVQLSKVAEGESTEQDPGLRLGIQVAHQAKPLVLEQAVSKARTRSIQFRTVAGKK